MVIGHILLILRDERDVIPPCSKVWQSLLCSALGPGQEEPCGGRKENQRASNPSQELRSERRNVIMERLQLGVGMTHAGEHTAVGAGFGIDSPGLRICPH